MREIIHGDALAELKKLPSDSVDCCITSPPYYQLRDYGVAGQIGLEQTVEEYIGKLVEVFREVRRVLKPDGTLWVNIADSYAGSGTVGVVAAAHGRGYVLIEIKEEYAEICRKRLNKEATNGQ